MKKLKAIILKKIKKYEDQVDKTDVNELLEILSKIKPSN